MTTDPRGDSAGESRDFYRRLGATGLAIRTKPEWDAQILESVLALLPASGRVLDVGCGYGRIAIPLAERTFDVTGLDISPNLLRAARREAGRRALGIRFDLGSMTALPYEEASFDAVICLWSAFHELIGQREQIVALAEMARVLVAGGIGVIEGAPADTASLDGGHRGDRVVSTVISGHRLRTVAHDATSLLRVAAAASVHGEVRIEEWAGRDRCLLLFRGTAAAPSADTLPA